MMSGARDDGGSSMPGRTMSPVTNTASLVPLRLFCVDPVVAVVLLEPHDPGVAGDAALPALNPSKRRPMPLIVFHVPDVSPITDPVTQFHPATTAFSS